MRMNRFRSGLTVRAWLAATLLALFVGPSYGTGAASDLPRPNGAVILTVSGDIAHRNSAAGAQFDREMLYDLGIATVRTSTPWTEGVRTFSGVPIRSVLDRVGARGNMVRAIALNDYTFEIPVAEFDTYPVLLAAEMDGRALTPRDKGPLWIIYPLDDLGTRDRLVERKMVWQLVEIRVQ